MITILGGGPSGLAVAFYAHRRGIPFVLYERSDELGGLCRTESCGPHRYDTGAHRFHDRDPATTADVRELLGEALVPVDAPSRILLDGRLVDFPPTPLNMILACGPRAVGRIGFELARRPRGRPVRTFAEFAEANFGRTLARRFLLDYTEKVWGLPAGELSADVATRRLAGMTLRTLLLELVVPSRKAAHIDGRFFYPRGGYGRIVEAIVRTLPAASIVTGREVSEIVCRDGRVAAIRFADAPEQAVEGRVVSTLPVTRLASALGPALSAEVHDAARELRFRDVRVVFVRLTRARVSRNASIYLPGPALWVSRVYEPKNRCASMAPEGETGLVAEVPCSPGEASHRADDAALAARVIAELEGSGLLRADEVLEWRHHRLSNAYPVYDVGYSERVRTVLDGMHLVGNLDVAGRNALFFYSHLHDQMHAARELVSSWTVEAAAGEVSRTRAGEEPRGRMAAR